MISSLRGCRLLLFLLVLSALTTAAFSQENRGSILGLVTDQASAKVSGARIRVTNLDTGIATSAATDQTGNYSVPFLPPGNYRVEVEVPGFATAANPSIALSAEQALRLDFSMQVGNIQQVISVTAQSPMLETASTSTGQTVGTKSIESLPLLSRNLASVALLGTGMQPSQNGISGVLSAILTNGATVTANGIRDSANQYTIDAANVNVGLYNYPSFVPVPDAVQEFTVQTGNYSAEYGQLAGAHVNYVLKSGTNSFHGNAFEYLQNNDLNARNYFSPSVPVLRQNQFGFVFGGPIKRNKTFFLVSYQGLRHFTDTYVQSVVITSNQRTGNLSLNTDGSQASPFIDPATGLPFVNNQIPSSRITPQAIAALMFDPAPSQTGAVNYAGFVNQPENGDGGLVKVDHSFGDRDQLSGRFLINDSSQTNLTGFAVPFSYLVTPLLAKNIALIETHAFSPATVLSTQASWNRQTLNQTYPQTPSDLDSRKVFDMVIPSDIAPGSPLNAYPYFAVSGYTPIGEYGNNPLFQRDQNYQIASELATSKGKHNLKFGFEVDRYRSYRFVNDETNGQQTFSPTNPAGSGNALADFLLGLPSSSQVATVPITVDLRRSAVDLYATDKWSITPKLTVEFGVRYEVDAPSNEHDGRISLFNFTPPGAFQTLSPGQELWHGDRDDFAPRLGITYGFTNKDVFRTSSGIYYSNSPQLNLTFAASNPPFISSYNFFAAAGSPLNSANAFPLGQAATGGVPSPFAIQTYQRTPAVYEWMFDLQHSFNSTLLLDVGYVGNRGVHFGRSVTQNVPLEGGPGSIQERRPLIDFGPVSSYQFDSFSTYNSLQARIEKRFSQGLSFLASYTFSKNLDLSSNELTGGTVIPTNLNFDYGPSDFDVRHNLTVSYVYDLPFGNGRRFMDTTGLVNEILGGWQLSGVTTLRSGFPFTVTYPGDVANVGLGTRPVRTCSGVGTNRSIQDWFNLSCFAAPAQYAFGNSGRGILSGPGYKNWDIGLMKSFPILWEHSIQFRAEFYNAFNNVNYGQPNSEVDTPGAGQITSASSARVGQFGLDYRF